MKRQTAWNGFYKAVLEAKRCAMQAKKDGHQCNVSTAWKMADMRAHKYAKSLVTEHGWKDVHTDKYYG